MRKILFHMAMLFLLGLLMQQVVLADEEYSFFSYLIPPSTTVTINSKDVSNTDPVMGKMIFKTEDEEVLEVEKEIEGVQIIAKNYQIDIKKESVLSLSARPELMFGSIHVITIPTSTGKGSVLLGGLILRFQSADFIAFVSRDQKEKIIKVIEGEVEIENPTSGQIATLKSNQTTSADVEGRLLIPTLFELSGDQPWWESDPYYFEYDSLPIANAGEEQRVLGNIPVVLDGNKSDFKTGDIFEWTLVKGPKDKEGNIVTEVAFDSTNIVKPLFTPIVEGEYQFSLQITNERGEKSNIDKVSIFVGREFLRPIVIFPDVPADHPNNVAITYGYKKGFLKGSEDPETGKITFRPDEAINRVEILKAIMIYLGTNEIPSEEELRSLEGGIFIDVQADHWFAPFVYLAKKLGWVNGHPDGTYRPADSVNLVEALNIITKAYQINLSNEEEPSVRPYPDAVDSWYFPLLIFGKKYNLIETDENGNSNPGQVLTRARFAEIIYRLDSTNIYEKRGYLEGEVRDLYSREAITDAEILIYKTLENGIIEDSGEPFIEKGELFYKTKTDKEGHFSVSLPVGIKYYIEAVSAENISNNKVITEVSEDAISVIELEMNIEKTEE